MHLTTRLLPPPFALSLFLCAASRFQMQAALSGLNSLDEFLQQQRRRPTKSTLWCARTPALLCACCCALLKNQPCCIQWLSILNKGRIYLPASLSCSPIDHPPFSPGPGPAMAIARLSLLPTAERSGAWGQSGALWTVGSGSGVQRSAFSTQPPLAHHTATQPPAGVPGSCGGAWCVACGAQCVCGH